MSTVTPEELHALLNPPPLGKREAQATTEAASHLISEIGRSGESDRTNAESDAVAMLCSLRDDIDVALGKLSLPGATL
jgi:hypothetical protein